MRKTLLTGGALASAVALLILLGSALELEVESVALFGAVIGAALMLIADRTPLARLGGFAAGFVAAWVGFAVRAAVLPDTSAGRAVTAFVVVVLCLAVAAGSRDRLPLWALLLGAAGLTGAYEYTYAAAPPEFLTTSVATATAMLLSVAVGLFAASLVDLPGRSTTTPGRDRAPRTPEPAEATSRARLDEMMETQK